MKVYFPLAFFNFHRKILGLYLVAQYNLVRFFIIILDKIKPSLSVPYLVKICDLLTSFYTIQLKNIVK